MKNPAPIAVTVVLIALITIGFFLFGGTRSDQTTIMESSQPSTQEMEATSGPELSKYLEFTPEVLAQNTQKRRVLYFYANWCPTCIPADKDFAQKSSEFPEDVVVIRVNYNDKETDESEKNLAKQYNVTYQHTFVQISPDGSVVSKWNGGESKELLENLK
jgi:thiol-disulfide isomerase/thioredoxin